MIKPRILRGKMEKKLEIIRSSSIDLVVADLPYGKTNNEWDKPIDLKWFWQEMYRVGKPTCAFLLFGQGTFSVDLVQSNRRDYRYDLVWEKDRPSGFLNSGKMPMRCHEQILVFYRKLPTYNPQMMESGKPHHGRRKQSGTKEHQGNYGAYASKKVDSTTTRHPRSVLQFDRPHPPIHPTQKPTDLIEWLIKTYSNPRDRVLDPSFGSGTTLLAAKNTDRRVVGIEADRKMVRVCKARIT